MHKVGFQGVGFAVEVMLTAFCVLPRPAPVEMNLRQLPSWGGVTHATANDIRQVTSHESRGGRSHIHLECVAVDQHSQVTHAGIPSCSHKVREAGRLGSADINRGVGLSPTGSAIPVVGSGVKGAPVVGPVLVGRRVVRAGGPSGLGAVEAAHVGVAGAPLVVEEVARGVCISCTPGFVAIVHHGTLVVGLAFVAERELAWHVGRRGAA
mmetsp:Transcript_145775/g.254495  ORF Transcript_145775/g.254495 Transcript_145775/m.254495 type:complete len:209 (+) Transcript_145775:1944-2570(+)